MTEILSLSDYAGFADGDRRDAFVHRQRFDVAFDYDVWFTRGVFRPENRLLLDVFDRKGERRRHRVFVCIDGGLAATRPELARGLRARRHVELTAAKNAALAEQPGDERRAGGTEEQRPDRPDNAGNAHAGRH